MKKIVSILIICFISLSVLTSAEENDFEVNKSRYQELCSKSLDQLSDAEEASCKAFIDYMSSQSTSLKKQLNDIENKRKEISANIKQYAQKIKDYDINIATLKAQIVELDKEISVKEEEIQTKEAEIETKQQEVDSLKNKVKQRIINSQKTMRVNPYIDIIIGSKNFNDLIRRSNGINAIINYDKSVLEEMANLIVELNNDKAFLVIAKADLDTKKEEIVEKRNTILAYRKEAEIIRQEYLKQEADLEAEGNRIAGDLASIKDTIATISSAIGQIAMSSGFIRPISGGRVSAGTWYYPSSFGGGVHLGMDFAAGIGTDIFAAGNGVIIKSVDGCGNDGHLGSSCGGNLGGSSGGGNQVYLLSRINGSLYAIKYLHMSPGTPIATGTIVNGGDKIGAVGRSGNVTGPHVHVEVFYLGSESIITYAQTWGGDLAFGANWGYSALNRLCENGVGAPCRVKPESLFGR